MARKTINAKPVIIHRCGECGHGTEYRVHSCRNVHGEYFCVTCPHNNFVRLKSERACEFFILRKYSQT